MNDVMLDAFIFELHALEAHLQLRVANETSTLSTMLWTYEQIAIPPGLHRRRRHELDWLLQNVRKAHEIAMDALYRRGPEDERQVVDFYKWRRKRLKSDRKAWRKRELERLPELIDQLD
jgi:hypothetical protein